MFLPQTKRRTVTFVTFVPFGEFEKTPDAVSVRLEAERWRQQPHKWKDLRGFVLMVERVSNVCSAVASCLFFFVLPPPLTSTWGVCAIISSFWPAVCWTNLIPVPPTGLSFWLTWFLPFNLEHWQDVSLKNSLFFIHIINKNQTFLLFFFFTDLFSSHSSNSDSYNSDLFTPDTNVWSTLTCCVCNSTPTPVTPGWPHWSTWPLIPRGWTQRTVVMATVPLIHWAKTWKIPEEKKFIIKERNNSVLKTEPWSEGVFFCGITSVFLSSKRKVWIRVKNYSSFFI